MSTHWSPSKQEYEKALFWGTAPPDVTELAKKNGSAHFNRVLHAVLMPQSAMPIGPHTGVLMERVSADYLAWVQAQPWSRRWVPWRPVAEYLTRFPLPEPLPTWPEHIAFVTPMQACAPTKEWHYPEQALLRPHPDGLMHEDKFHTFALGALGLRPHWYDAAQHHYRLTAHRREWAIKEGAFPLLPDARQSGAVFQRLRAGSAPTCTKHCYGSQDQAQGEIDRLLTGHRRNRPDYLRAYECPRCSFWHLTRQKLPHE